VVKAVTGWRRRCRITGGNGRSRLRSGHTRRGRVEATAIDVNPGNMDGCVVLYRNNIQT
jgi:hypothetical protein